MTVLLVEQNQYLMKNLILNEKYYRFILQIKSINIGLIIKYH